jgi:hypothetical protein
MGRLSNPPVPLETLAGQGIAGSRETRERAPSRPDRALGASAQGDREERGRLSNPWIEPTTVRGAEQASAATARPGPHRTQTRLHTVEVDELVAAYRAGDGVEQLAERFGVHRSTVLAHLGRRQVQLRSTFTTWDHDALTAAAAAYYASGASLATVAARFGVDPSTVANRFRRAGVAVRPRLGWV